MAAKRFLGRDAILAVQDITQREVFVPEWDTWVIVRGMTAKDRDSLEESMRSGSGKKVVVTQENFRAKVVALCLVDNDGKRIFSLKDVQALGEKSAVVLDRLATLAADISGMTEQDTEELLKNSEGGQPAASPSA